MIPRVQSSQRQVNNLQSIVDRLDIDLRRKIERFPSA